MWASGAVVGWWPWWLGVDDVSINIYTVTRSVGGMMNLALENVVTGSSLDDDDDTTGVDPHL
jgi:hypothetical protein